jgi:site-specific DNA recombinase
MFDKKLKEYKEKQSEINSEMQKHNVADENYYITVNTVLNLAQQAYKIFQSSEVQEKRQLLGFLLQNAQLQDKQFAFDLKKPFDSIAETAKKQKQNQIKKPDKTSDPFIWLGSWDSNPGPIGYTSS